MCNLIFITIGFLEKHLTCHHRYNEKQAELQSIQETFDVEDLEESLNDNSVKQKGFCQGFLACESSCCSYFCKKYTYCLEWFIFPPLTYIAIIYYKAYSLVLWLVVLCLISSIFVVGQWSFVMSLLDPVNFLPLGVFVITCLATLIYSWVGLTNMITDTRVKIRSSFQNIINKSLDAFLELYKRKHSSGGKNMMTSLAAAATTTGGGGDGGGGDATVTATNDDKKKIHKFSSNDEPYAEAKDMLKIFEIIVAKSRVDKKTMNFVEFQKLLKALCFVDNRPYLQYRMFAHCDVNGDGEIDRYEFVAGWDWLMAELVEQVGQELGVTDTRIAIIFLMLLIWVGLMFTFLVLFIGVYDNTTEFSSMVTSTLVVVSGYFTKVFNRLKRGDYADKSKIQKSVSNVIGDHESLDSGEND